MLGASGSPTRAPSSGSWSSWGSPSMPRLLVTTLPPPQVQACLLLQKTLPTRELRVCFKDPEWKQLLGQTLGKVTEVTALHSPPLPAGCGPREPRGEGCWTLCLRVGLGLPQGGFGVPPGDVSSLGTLVSHMGDELRAALRSGSAQPPSPPDLADAGRG